MTNPRDDRLFSSLSKNRKSPPRADSQSGFFQTGQGGRTVLPPLSSAFPTSPSSVPAPNYPSSYSQPRPSPTKIDHSSSYPHWSSIPIPQQHPNYYDHYDRYSQTQPYAAYPSRSSPGIPPDPHNSRKLPPLSTPDRYGNYGAVAPQLSNYPDVRSPTATYPDYYPQTSYSFPPVPDQRHHSSHHPSMHHHSQSMATSMYSIPERGMPAQVEAHGLSPYARGPITNTRLTDEPTQMAAVIEEPTIKKKRKRADAAQLKVLNETYERTAFPSTEERAELARKLDMSARSVQIWFQNKRQSMRQTSRQSTASVPTSQQSYNVSSNQEDSSFTTGSISPTAVPQSAYTSRASQDSRSLTQDSRSSLSIQRREEDPRNRWHSSGRY